MSSRKQKQMEKEREEKLPPVEGKSWLIGEIEEHLPFEEEEVLHKVSNRTYLVVIAYDIIDNKRRTKLAKLLEGFGERVQYSVFEAHLTLRQWEDMIKKILPFIDEKEDLLRIYRLTGNTDIQVWGKVERTYNEDFIVI